MVRGFAQQFAIGSQAVETRVGDVAPRGCAAVEAPSPASAPPTPSATTKIPRAASARNESSFSGRLGFNPRSLTDAADILPAGVGVLIERPPDRRVRESLGGRGRRR